MPNFSLVNGTHHFTEENTKHNPDVHGLHKPGLKFLNATADILFLSFPRLPNPIGNK